MKKVISFVSVLLMILGIAVVAHAEVNKDSNGIITWTFASPEPAIDLPTADSYQLYDGVDLIDSSSKNYLSDVKNASNRELLLVIFSKNGSKLGAGFLSGTYAKNNLKAIYIPKETGKIFIEGSSLTNKLMECSEADKAYWMTLTANAGKISKITFVPNTATHSLTFTAKKYGENTDLNPVISLQDINENAITDDAGTYNSLYGTYTYTATLEGYHTLSGEITMTGSDRIIELEMIPEDKSAVRCVTSDGVVLKTIAGDAESTIYYPVIINSNGKYYKTSESSYGKKFTAAGIQNVVYTEDENIVYFAEGEDIIQDASATVSENDTSYSSGNAKVPNADSDKSGFSAGSSYPAGMYKVTARARRNTSGGGSGRIYINGNSIYVKFDKDRLETLSATVKLANDGEITMTYGGYNTNLLFDYIYIERVTAADTVGDASYVGAYTPEGEYDFTAAGAVSGEAKKTDDGATAYKATFSNTSQVYTNPSIAWKIVYGDTAPQTGTLTRIVEANESVNEAESTFGLVVNGALLAESDTTSITATIKDSLSN